MLQAHLLFCRLSVLVHSAFPYTPHFLTLQAFSLLLSKQSPLEHFFFLAMSCSKNCIIYGLTGALQSADHTAFHTLYPAPGMGALQGSLLVPVPARTREEGL